VPPPAKVEEAVKSTTEEEKRRRRLGLKATIATSPQGVLQSAEISRPGLRGTLG
jgi:hypothetical protein